MSRSLKGLMACIILIISLTIFISNAAMAQVGFGFPPYPYFPSNNPPVSKRSTIIEGDILIEDFEYTDTIHNHGWSQGWGVMNIWPPGIIPIFDSLKGSWVLDGYYPESVFLLGTPYEKKRFTYDLFTPSTQGPDSAIDHISLDTYPIASFYYRSTEAPKVFEFYVGGFTKSDCIITLKIIFNKPPKETLNSHQYSPFIKIDKKNASYSENVTVIYQESLLVTVYVLDEIVDNFWHDVWVDVSRIIKEAVDHYVDYHDDLECKEDWYMDQATHIIISSYNFRIDDIFFRSERNYSSKLSNPDLFEMGPLYVQIFKPYRFLFIADYEGLDITVHDINGNTHGCSQINEIMLNPDNFLLVQDPNDPNDPVVKYWTDLGADPDKFGKESDPNLKALFGRDFTVDLNLPIFADPEMRVGGSIAKRIIDQGSLGFNATISGDRIYCFLIQPFPVYPYDGMPTYLPAHYNVLDVIAALGKPYYQSELVYSLEGALWNAGITIWPNIAVIDYTPQYFEEQIVTIEVTDGINYDIRRFPINVVQYPVENHSPVLQLPVEDLIFFVGEAGKTQVNFIDPDCFIFSMSSTCSECEHPRGFPVSEDFRTDMDELIWGIHSITLDGQMVPLTHIHTAWCGCDVFSELMDDFDYCDFRTTGVIQFTPQSEKTLDIGINVSDEMGGTAFGEIKIMCVSRSDLDGDLIYDSLDNCPEDPNPGQADIDQDGIGDICDLCPNDINNDIDGDDLCGDVDNCPDIFNPDQADTNGNNIGDACDSTPDTPDNSQDGACFPYNRFWPRVSNFFGFMPNIFSGYRPNLNTGKFSDNFQIPYLFPFSGSYAIHGYWPIPVQNPIMNYLYSEGLYRNDLFSNSSSGDSFMYPFWISPLITKLHIQY
ncbi:MAG: thrombospondin type 3 repeat-containing protein [bacterium]